MQNHFNVNDDSDQVRLIPLGPLTFVFYPEPDLGLICAHCLELDIAGQGDTREAAEADLQNAISTYLEYCFEERVGVEAGTPDPDLKLIQDRETHCPVIVLVAEHEECPSQRTLLFQPPQPRRFDPSSLAALA